jgi:hypothetical protein
LTAAEYVTEIIQAWIIVDPMVQSQQMIPMGSSKYVMVVAEEVYWWPAGILGAGAVIK